MVAGTNVYTVPCQPDIIFDGFGFMGFFVTKLTKNFPSRANLGKIDSQLWWWLCIRVGWCPWKDDDWCYSRRSRLKNNQRRDVQGFYRARTPIRLVHSKQSPAAESAFSIFLQKKVTNFSLTCWDQVACLFLGLNSKKSIVIMRSVPCLLHCWVRWRTETNCPNFCSASWNYLGDVQNANSDTTGLFSVKNL